jgi:hypothetical protein
MDPLVLNTMPTTMCFQFSMLNFYHPYQCHLQGRAIMWHWPACLIRERKLLVIWILLALPFRVETWLWCTSKQGVCVITMLPCHLHETISEDKSRIMKTQIFHHAKIFNLQKPSKRNQNPSRYYNSITNIKFQHTPKYHLSKILI